MVIVENDKQWMTVAELLKRWRGAVGKATLANWRSHPNYNGPKWMRIGKMVLYDLDDVARYEKEKEGANPWASDFFKAVKD